MRSSLVGTAERHLKMDLIYQYLGKPGMENVNYWITDSLNPAFNNNTDWQSNVIQKARIQELRCQCVGLWREDQLSVVL